MRAVIVEIVIAMRTRRGQKIFWILCWRRSHCDNSTAVVAIPVRAITYYFCLSTMQP
ncbi:hypothetical protein [Chlorogloeopsis sp. ULAP02]|uniref:hypothetical protein n=1 Tax=Chlorogloeopsis sp. ULAP02 TaxID=3107926 RepID=UPI003134AB88